MSRVLLVDDGDILLRVVSRKLSALGCSVTGETDVGSALRFVADGCTIFDVVLTDYHLPDGNGADLARALEGHLPVVLFAGDLNAVPQAHRDLFAACFSKLDSLDLVGARLAQLSQTREP